VPLAQALVAGGVRVLEVTLRTPVALQCMEAIAKAVPDAIVGAGTVRSWPTRRRARRRLPLRRQPGLPREIGIGLPRDRAAAAARRGHRQRGDAGQADGYAS
jgi:2-dehydro-3-deoxyphosphogluconate aldolase/(4S)-4-hydroxy-2-oxoglutarate aldolase